MIALTAMFAITVDASEVRFDRDVRPILSDKCFFCHGPDEENRQADLRLDIESEAKATFVAGDLDSSELIARIVSEDADSVMPPPDAHKEMTPAEVQVLKDWVQQGAQWTEHWAFVAPSSPMIPKSEIGEWGQNRIDDFVFARMARAGLQPKPQASREKLIRRLAFDLTGLPPTIEEIEDFLSDDSADAYERLVDRLLQSDHFGQRMALAWLDAARYGDTSVYHADGPRDMWAWRDAVVDAYNNNLAFDQFSILQLAGDLIPDVPLEHKVLAGFNRNNGTTDEGGAIAEEYRIEYAVDRVKTTATVWMGLTMECAQCHDHKYDPISQEEYYKFFAFFNVSRDGGMQTRKGNAEPKIDIPDPDKVAKIPETQKLLAEARELLAEHDKAAQPEFESWLAAAEQDTSGADELPKDRLIHFALDEGKGKKVNGTVDNKRVGKFGGKVQWTPTRNGSGLKFDGKSHVDLGDLANFERTESFSYGGWVKPYKGGHGALLARMDNSNSYRGFDVLCGDNRIEVHIIHSWPNNCIKVRSEKPLKADEWSHLFVTYDGSSKADGVHIYVNGEEMKWKIEQNNLSKTIQTDKSLRIGSRHGGSVYKGEIDEVTVFDRELTQAEVQQLAGSSPVKELLAIPTAERSDDQIKTLRNHYLTTQDKEYVGLKKKVEALVTREADLKKPLTSVMVMGDADKPRETFVLNRGAYDSPTDQKVEMGTMAVLPPMDDSLPKNRLGLAKWLFQSDHPLTARVAVNRHWQMLFGRGLVSTPGDFGAQGEFPSHPELLDWLAVDFRENGWNIKRLVKQIVMSSTYRQTSAASVKEFRSDPNNVLLARGSRFRLQGEFIRDNALFVSGLLVDKFGGPGVKPYQPPGLWAEVGLGGNPKFKQDKGEKLYRRSLYTYWKRSAPPPSMQIFDAPTREKCTVQRPRTNTPLQALVTLNDIQFVEAARHFAERILAEGGDSNREKIRFGFRQVTAREPSKRELDTMLALVEDLTEQYGKNPDAASKLLAIGESPRDESLDTSTHAAWSMLASTLLNLDETLTRE